MHRIKDIYFFFVLIYSGFGTSFYRSKEGIIVLFLLTVILMYFYKVKVTKKYIHVIVIWLIYSAIVSVKNREVHELFVFRHIVYITVSYFIYILFKEKVFIKFENYVIYLALLSLPFVLWQWISPSSLNSFGSLIDISGWVEKNNFIIYTQELRFEYFFPRNCGFTWEPGPFSVFISIAILINLYLNDFKISGNKRLLILFVALITTQSTTGFTAIGALAGYIIFKEVKGNRKIILGTVFISVFISLFLTLGFMYEKIVDQIEDAKQIQAKLDRAILVGTSYSTGRVGGFVIGWQDFKRNPIVGIGGKSEARYATIDGAGLSIRNGWGLIMSTYGLFGIIVSFLVLKNSSKFLSKYFNSNAIYGLFLIVLFSNTGFYLFDKPILFAIIFYTVFIKSSWVLQRSNDKRKKSSKALSHPMPIVSSAG